MQLKFKKKFHETFSIIQFPISVLLRCFANLTHKFAHLPVGEGSLNNKLINLLIYPRNNLSFYLFCLFPSRAGLPEHIGRTDARVLLQNAPSEVVFDCNVEHTQPLKAKKNCELSDQSTSDR